MTSSPARLVEGSRCGAFLPDVPVPDPWLEVRKDLPLLAQQCQRTGRRCVRIKAPGLSAAGPEARRGEKEEEKMGGKTCWHLTHLSQNCSHLSLSLACLLPAQGKAARGQPPPARGRAAIGLCLVLNGAGDSPSGALGVKASGPPPPPRESR